MARGSCCTTVLCAIFLAFTYRSHVAETVALDVEGFEGGTVTLPCTLPQRGTLRWRQSGGVGGGNVIATKPLGGPVIIQENGPYTGVVSITGEFNLRISSLSADRDNNREFTCYDSGPGGGSQVTTVRVLVRITGASILEANNGRVIETAGEPKTLTCTVTGNPNPSPSYTWTVDDRTGAGQESTFSLTADKSTKTVKCTATNRYSNGSELSTAETTATLNVLYLDSPTTPTSFTVTENQQVTLACRAEGNPPPSSEWRRSGTTEIRSSAADYTIQNVERSAAGEYTCTVSNSVGSDQTSVTLLVRYPPNVTVTYDSRTQTLTCTADGVPNTYTFSPWEHRVGGKLVQTSDRNSTTLTLPGTLTYEDTGDYVCSVSNGIKQTQTGHQYIAPQNAAVFEDQKQNLTLGLGTTQEISVLFYTHSEAPNVKVKWRKSGDSNLLQSHREEKGPVSLVFHGQTVSIEGTITVLTLRNVTKSDEGNYTVSVTSDVNGVSMTETKHKRVYVEVKTIPGNGASVGTIVGGALTAVGIVVVVITVGVLWYRRKRLHEAPGMRPHRSLSHGGTPETSRGFAPVYEVTSLQQNYQNVNQEPQYEQLQKRNQNSDLQDQGYSVDYETTRPPDYGNSPEGDGEKNPSIDFVNSGAAREIIMTDHVDKREYMGHENRGSVDYENKGGHYVDPVIMGF